MKNEEKKYHFLTASTSYYSGNNFNDLIKEEKEYKGCVCWSIGSHHIEKGDVCLIYYSKLPDRSSRVLFAGEVIDSDYGSLKKESVCNEAKLGEKFAKLKLVAVSRNNNDIFSLERLRDYYNLVSKKGQFSYLHVDDRHAKLIKDIEQELKYKNKTIYYVKSTGDYFNNNYCMCELCGKNSFIEENGFYYIEDHHLVEKSLIKKYKKIKNIEVLIDKENNRYNLCPVCHRKIHYGKIEDRMPMIKELYKKNKSFYDNKFNELKGDKKTLDWLYEIYKCNK